MKRRDFYKLILGTTVGVAGVTLLGGCASKISREALDKKAGDPFRCSKCGYLTRSKVSLTLRRCPRCYTKNMVAISEEDMARFLAEEAAKKDAKKTEKK